MTMAADDEGALLDDYIDSEITSEWQRKSSLETRAFSVITANLALVTLFLAFRLQFQLGSALGSGWPHGLTLLALFSAAVSIAAAAISALPWNYPSPEPDALNDLSTQLLSGPADVRGQIREVKIAQLKNAVCANQWKGWMIFVGFAAMGLAFIAMAITLTLAVSV